MKDVKIALKLSFIFKYTVSQGLLWGREAQHSVGQIFGVSLYLKLDFKRLFENWSLSWSRILNVETDDLILSDLAVAYCYNWKLIIIHNKNKKCCYSSILFDDETISFIYLHINSRFNLAVTNENNLNCLEPLV